MSGFGGRDTAATFGPNGGEPSAEWHRHSAEVLNGIEPPPKLWAHLSDPRQDPEYEVAPASWRPYLAGTLGAVESFVRRFVVFPSPHEAVAVALWVAHTHVADTAEVSPYLQVTSPEKRSGKTRLLDALELVVHRPWRAVNPSEAVIYRKVEADRPTLLLDEVDAIFGTRSSDRSEGIRALLNAGNRRGTTVPRMVGDGRKMRVHDFPTFCPKVLAGIGRLPDTVADRSITIGLERRSRREPVERFRYRVAKVAADALRDALLDALGTVSETLAEARPEIPDALSDRAADSWEPLLAIAEAAGGDWTARARAAAIALSGERVDDLDDASLSLLLLADCRAAFIRRGLDRLPTVGLIEDLLADEEKPWHEVGRQGKPISPHYLSRQLRPYRVKPKGLRIGQVVQKGYDRSDFEPAWDRYLPPLPEPTNGYTVTQALETHAETVADEPTRDGVTVDDSVAGTDGRHNGADGIGALVAITDLPVEMDYPRSAWGGATEP